jgi:hypothetical protein
VLYLESETFFLTRCSKRHFSGILKGSISRVLESNGLKLSKCNSRNWLFRSCCCSFYGVAAPRHVKVTTIESNVAAVKVTYKSLRDHVTRIANPISLLFSFLAAPRAPKALYVAEREGFEPSRPFWGLRDFESRAFDHSAISPFVAGLFWARCVILAMGFYT